MTKRRTRGAANSAGAEQSALPVDAATVETTAAASMAPVANLAAGVEQPGVVSAEASELEALKKQLAAAQAALAAADAKVTAAAVEKEKVIKQVQAGVDPSQDRQPGANDAKPVEPNAGAATADAVSRVSRLLAGNRRQEKPAAATLATSEKKPWSNFTPAVTPETVMDSIREQAEATLKPELVPVAIPGYGNYQCRENCGSGKFEAGKTYYIPHHNANKRFFRKVDNADND